MLIRIIRGQTQPGKLDEMAAIWREVIAPRITSVPGLRNAYFTGDRDTNTVVGVSIWESRPDDALLNQGMEELRARAGSIAAGPPTIEEFEVLDQV
jgi:heme-degrading monooxygenase HmoA